MAADQRSDHQYAFVYLYSWTVEKLARTILENSGFSQAAYKRLLEATDGDPLDKGLQWEVWETEGTGPDVQ